VPAAGSDAGFGDVFLGLAEADPERPALTCEDVTLSRRELVDRAGRLAVQFAQLGVVTGSLVTIALPNSLEFVETMLAAWWLGAVPQPISDRLPMIERRAIVELADPALAVGIPADEAEGHPIMSAEEVTAAAEGPVSGLVPSPVTAPMWKVITSGGSTGRPKLIVAGQPAVLAVADAFASLLDSPTTGPCSSPVQWLTTARSS
jgi:bile acid-coenzyme A ligase